MKNRVGEVGINRQGTKMVIIEYFSAKDITVKFIDGIVVRGREYSKFKIGSIENPMVPALCSIGFMGQGVYSSKELSHQRWQDMLKRCYLGKNPAYKDCRVHEDWHNFQNFAKWYEENYIEGWDLDKDILIKGNKVYSSTTCCFVPPEISQLFKNSISKNKDLPPGVRRGVNFYSYLNTSRRFSTDFEAAVYHNYLLEKRILSLADKWKEILPYKTYYKLTESRRVSTISIDFDSTCVSYKNPGVGVEIGATLVLRKLVDEGHKLILSTMRSNRDRGLRDAVEWFQSREIPLYGIQSNPGQLDWSGSPKVYADLIIDDTALGIPLKTNLRLSDKPFVDWKGVEKLLIEKNILKSTLYRDKYTIFDKK